MHNILFANYPFVNSVRNLRNVLVKSMGKIRRRIDSRLFTLYACGGDHCKLYDTIIIIDPYLYIRNRRDESQLLSKGLQQSHNNKIIVKQDIVVFNIFAK